MKKFIDYMNEGVVDYDDQFDRYVTGHGFANEYLQKRESKDIYRTIKNEDIAKSVAVGVSRSMRNHRNSLIAPMTVFHLSKNPILEPKDLKSKTWKTKSFLSTSTDKFNSSRMATLGSTKYPHLLTIYLPKGFNKGVHIKDKQGEYADENEYLIDRGVHFRHLKSEEGYIQDGSATYRYFTIHHLEPIERNLYEGVVETPEISRYIMGGSEEVNAALFARNNGSNHRQLNKAIPVLKSMKSHKNSLIAPMTVYHLTGDNSIVSRKDIKSGTWKTKSFLSTSTDKFNSAFIKHGFHNNMLVIHLPKGFDQGVHIKSKVPHLNAENEYLINPNVIFRHIGSETQIHHGTEIRVHEFEPIERNLYEGVVDYDKNFDEYIEGSRHTNSSLQKRADGYKKSQFGLQDAMKVSQSMKNNRNSLIEPMTVYHGTRYDSIINDKDIKSGTWKTKSFLSTSTGRTSRPSRPTILAIHLPKGFNRGVHIKHQKGFYEDEREYLIDKDVHFRIIKSEKTYSLDANGEQITHHLEPIERNLYEGVVDYDPYIQNYIQGSSNINSFLQDRYDGQREHDDEDMWAIKGSNRILRSLNKNKNALIEPTTVWHMSNMISKSDLKSGFFTTKSPLSTSTDHDNEIVRQTMGGKVKTRLAIHLPKGFDQGVHIADPSGEHSGENEYLINRGVRLKHIGTEVHPDGGTIYHLEPHQSFLPEGWIEDHDSLDNYILGSTNMNQFLIQRHEKPNHLLSRLIPPKTVSTLKAFKDHKNHIIEDTTVYHHYKPERINSSEFKKSGFFKTKAILSTSIDFDNPDIVGYDMTKRDILALHLPKGFSHGLFIRSKDPVYRDENEYIIKPGVMFRHLGSEKHPEGVGEIHHFSPHQFFLP